MNENTVKIPVPVLVDTARSLWKANRFAEAGALLGSATGAGDDPRLALASAEVTIATDWFAGRATDPESLAEPKRVIDAHGDAETAWDLEFLFVRRGYGERLFSEAGRWRKVEAPDLEEMNALRTRAEALRDNAPDGRRRGWAEFYLGLIGDNVFSEREGSPAHYAQALRAGEEHADDHLLFEALRHLGDHDHDAGDLPLTRQRWERSAHHAARAGLVGSTLAQLMLVAVSARDDGDEGGAVLLATEVARWADAIGYERQRDMAESFVKGVDPTVQEEED
ncbi:hypothetical protein [Stackebrandtia nassauensis]|uniref:Uncharacterized protein n=1 Tax=Stackebrandtia nassauensis (strain DSM 44728 / CIP 108903 / NRRL B-16338 / NBRC 102104 / LLR-40K-21) TaxID=446470 RepID=D3Q839_STANL|nr:hypothetical protein [Stackebrandtia nassauensis]ADD40544.1 hypothetical protein Snas_0832 [Stackebrandtia nassauensis DSM 44728]